MLHLLRFESCVHLLEAFLVASSELHCSNTHSYVSILEEELLLVYDPPFCGVEF